MGLSRRQLAAVKEKERKEKQKKVKEEKVAKGLDVEKADEPAPKRSKRAHIPIKDEGGDDKPNVSQDNWTPDNWPESYENIKKMMKGVFASVESLPWFQDKDPKETKPEERFRILVALMLSSRTKDEHLLKAWNALCNEGLSIDWVEGKEVKEIADLIKSSSFYNVKAKHIKETAAILKEQYDNDTPDTFKQLTELPGVGSKLAVLFLQCCYGRAEGIAPDAHIVRTVNRLHWVKKPVNCHTRTRSQLESWIPKDQMIEFNRLISRFGQVKCHEVPKCGECLNKDICPGARKSKK